MRAPRIRVEIWSDIACPWCYIGRARFAAGLDRFAHRDEVEVVHRSFELDRHFGETVATTDPDYAHAHGLTSPGAREAEERIAAVAHEEGLAYHVATREHGNTFDLHRLIHFATEQGVGDELLGSVYAENFGSDRSVFDRDVLVELELGVGLDEDAARRVLDDPTRYADQVRADEADAAALGITGVPFFVVDRTYGLSGAQPAELFTEVLSRAWNEKEGSE